MNLSILGNPFVVASIVSLILFYLSRNNIKTNKNYEKKNKKESKKFISDSMKNNIKISIYLFIILVIILYLKDKLLVENNPENLEFKGGKPPF
jgi:hypothetical protein